MNFEPQKFFIGLMEFFSILLPGAVLTYLLGTELGSYIVGAGALQKMPGAEKVAVFLIASYLWGHLLFLIGAWLDEFPYDWVRRRYTLNKQITCLALRGTLLPIGARILIWSIFKQEQDIAVDRAGKIKEQLLAGLAAEKSINTFQWSKAFLAKEHPDSLALVHRFEADSKFFRSFVVALLFLASYWGLHERVALGVTALVLIVPALWRYMDQRYKATNQAYWSVITLTAREGKVVLPKDGPTKAETSHAGGVVFRIRGGQAEYLLVEAKRDPKQWVLPKGHIEGSEDPKVTAVREVHEETGVWAKVHAPLSAVQFYFDDKTVTMTCYLMEAIGQGRRSDVFREHRWLSEKDAHKLASHVETREVIRAAQHRVERLMTSRKTALHHKVIRMAKRARRIIRLIVKDPAPHFGE